jgi:hypothetical protein
MDVSAYIFIALGLLGVGILVFVRIHGSSQRKRQIANAAQYLGLSRTDSPFTRSDRKDLTLLSRGNSGKLINVSGGEKNGVTLYLFDYRYRFGMPIIASVIYTQTVLAVRLHPNPLPAFRLTPSTSLDRAAAALGMKTVKLPPESKLTKKYLLYGSEDAQLEAIFNSAAVAMLQDRLMPSGLTIEGAGEWLLFYVHGKLLPANTMLSLADDAFWYLRLLAHVNC